MVRRATIEDSHILAELAIQLWDDNTLDALNAEFSESINSNQAVFFIKYEDNIPVGFAQCSLRTDYVEGTETSPVGYLEGIFVKSAHPQTVSSSCHREYAHVPHADQPEEHDRLFQTSSTYQTGCPPS